MTTFKLTIPSIIPLSLSVATLIFGTSSTLAYDASQVFVTRDAINGGTHSSNNIYGQRGYGTQDITWFNDDSVPLTLVFDNGWPEIALDAKCEVNCEGVNQAVKKTLNIYKSGSIYPDGTNVESYLLYPNGTTINYYIKEYPNVKSSIIVFSPLKGKVLSSSEFELTWGRAEMGSGGSVTDYSISMLKFDQLQSNSFRLDQVKSTASTTATINNLSPDTKYVFSVTANTSHGSYTTESIYLTTLKATPATASPKSTAVSKSKPATTISATPSPAPSVSPSPITEPSPNPALTKQKRIINWAGVIIIVGSLLTAAVVLGVHITKKLILARIAKNNNGLPQ